jgi:transaldolase
VSDTKLHPYRTTGKIIVLYIRTVSDKRDSDAGINTRGTIFYKSVQILAFAGIDVISITQNSMKEALFNQGRAAKKTNLQINQNKTKYMPVTKNECASGPVHIEIGSYKFETVCSFTYLG